MYKRHIMRTSYVLIQVYIAWTETKTHLRNLEVPKVLSYTGSFMLFTNFIHTTWSSLVKTKESYEARG
jgi:hypothetical protein